MIDQDMGGDIVYIVSKNAFFAGPNNVAYGAAKADQAHQVRLLAAELGAYGIRVNGVNPDGVVRGSGIFAKGWGADRARTYGDPGGQARRVLRPADAPQARGPAGARRRGRVRADRRRPVADDRAPHPGRRRRRGRVPAVTGRRRRGGRPRRVERAGHRRPGRRRRAARSTRSTASRTSRSRCPTGCTGMSCGCTARSSRACAGRRAASDAARERRHRLVGGRLRPARRRRRAASANPFHYRDPRTARGGRAGPRGRPAGPRSTRGTASSSCRSTRSTSSAACGGPPASIAAADDAADARPVRRTG